MAAQAAQLYELAQEKLCVDEYESALNCLQQATTLDADNQEYLSAYGSLLAEVGKQDEAVKALQAGVARFPDTGFEKYMYLGQLLEGEAAIQTLQKGIEVLQQESEQQMEDEDRDVMRSQLASGLCSLAELHMASLPERDIDSVVQLCKPLLQRAADADEKSPEPKQVLASLRNEQGQTEEALKLLKESLALWFRPPPDEEEGQEESIDLMEEDLMLPSFEFRFEAAKLLVELDETTEDAIEILEELLQENDQDVNVYYLLAMAHLAGGDHETAQETLAEGEALIQKLQIPADHPAIAGYAQLKENIGKVKQEEERELPDSAAGLANGQ